ncbi:hypothetical protein ABPG72_008073 [Tetrahymena utriculariae]
MNFEITKRISSLIKSRATSNIKHQIQQPQQMSYLRINSQKNNNNKTELKYVKNEINESRVKKLKLLHEHSYKPTPYLSNRFLQSLYNITFSDNLRINYKRELVKLQDGGQISLDWALPFNLKTGQEYNPSDDTKILFVSHGLTGGSNMNYIKQMIQQGQASGYRCVAFNSRGINTYSPFGEFPEINSAFFNLFHDAPYLVEFTKNFLLTEKTHSIDFNKVAKVRSLRDYHEQLLIKLFNYSSVDEYFEKSMVEAEQLLNIKCPSLLLHSKGDPIVTYECIPQETLRKNPFIIQADTENGAHNCWFTGLIPERWYPKPVIQFFEVLLEENYQQKQYEMEEKYD